MTKRIIAKILMVIMVFNLLAVCVFAADSGQENVTAVLNKEVKFMWDGTEYKPVDPVSNKRVYALMYNDRTYIPARFIAEKAGITVGWDQDTQSVLFEYAGQSSANQTTNIETSEIGVGAGEVSVVLNKDIKFIWNGSEFKPFDPVAKQRVYAIMYNDRTYIPARFIAENAGIIVTWDQNTQSVIFDALKFKEPEPTPVPTVKPEPTPEPTPEPVADNPEIKSILNRGFVFNGVNIIGYDVMKQNSSLTLDSAEIKLGYKKDSKEVSGSVSDIFENDNPKSQITSWRYIVEKVNVDLYATYLKKNLEEQGFAYTVPINNGGMLFHKFSKDSTEISVIVEYPSRGESRFTFLFTKK